MVWGFTSKLICDNDLGEGCSCDHGYDMRSAIVWGEDHSYGGGNIYGHGSGFD